MEELSENHAIQVKDLTNSLRPLRRELSQLELQRMEIGWKVRRSSWDPGSSDYQKLRKIRREIAIKRLEAIKIEKALAAAKSTLYGLNRTLRAPAANIRIAESTSEVEISNEDYVENVRIDHYGYLFLAQFLTLHFLPKR